MSLNAAAGFTAPAGNEILYVFQVFFRSDAEPPGCIATRTMPEARTTKLCGASRHFAALDRFGK